MLRCFATEGPWTCKAIYVDRSVVKKDTEAKRLGSLFHLGMEKPDSWRDEVTLLPEVVPDSFGDKLSKAELSSDTHVQGGMKLEKKFKRHSEYLQWYINTECRGKQVMEPDELRSVERMITAVHENPATRKFVSQGLREVPATAVHLPTGLATRGLADIWHDDLVVDFKSTRFGTRREFVRDAYSKGYHYQMAHYCSVFGAKRAVIIAVRNFEPFESMVFELPQSKLKEASESNDRYLDQMNQCFELGDWHSLGWGTVNSLEFEDLREDVQGAVTHV